jgi:hydrolase
LDISHVLLTHWHFDHIGGVEDLISHNPKLASRIYKYQPDSGQLPIMDGQIFHAEGATIQAVFTPGHSVDHMCFVLKEEQALFTGDNVLGHGFTVIEDLGAYMSSLRYMGDQECSVGYPGHGAKIEDLSSTIQQYIRREEIRVNQVYSILVERCFSTRRNHGRRASFTSEELVTFLYGEVSNSLFRMALEPCMNRCLWKLAEDGKVGFELVQSNRLWYARLKVYDNLV